MRKMLLITFLFLVSMTSACSAQAAGETITPTLSETLAVTATQTPVATKTQSALLIATSTPETPVPTNLPNCTNSAAFVADVTIPDNSSVTSSTAFTKVWRVKNTGTCIWGPEYTLSHYSEERMLAPASVPLSVTFPGQTVELSMELTSPRANGIHKAFFVIKNPAGLIMKIDNDSRLWVVIDVSVEVASVPTATQVSGSVPITGGGLLNAACAYTTETTKVSETINAINVYRAANGLTAYVINELLTKAATAHANDMACNKLFGHTGSEGSTPDTRVAASGYVASSVTENVYGSYPPLSGQGAVDWWKNDKTDIRHNQNLLSTTYTEIGIGYSFYENFGYYVLVFATPK
jgi:uncharacterized protein YkwD